MSENVLGDDIGQVQLIDSMGSDLTVVNSARVSFGKRIQSVEEKDEKLIRFLLAHSHGTPLEHTSLTFLVKCPLFIARQWHRHRVGASINEISARYVEVKEEFYIPQSFRKQSSSNRQASVDDFVPEDRWVNLGDDVDVYPCLEDKRCANISAYVRDAYKGSLQTACITYWGLLDAGVAREQARAVLPLATYTEFYWTCNLRSLFHFVELRDHPNAQWEMQQYAKTVLELARPIFPATIKIWEELKKLKEKNEPRSS